MIFERTKSQCKYCPLMDRPKVHSRRPSDGTPTDIMFLSEAPGATEELAMEPLVGPSGRFFNKSLFEVGLDRRNVWIANVINCRPANNDISTIEGSEAIACCTAGLRDELNIARKTGVKVIVAQGQTALAALGIEGQITKVRGSVYEKDQFHIIPTFHPSYIIRNGGYTGAGRNSASPAVAYISDLRKAVEISKDGWEAPKEVFNIAPTLQQVNTFVQKAIALKSLIAVDTETTGLDRNYGKLVVIGLADSESSALSIPLLDLKGTEYWNEYEKPKVIELVNKVFSACPLVFQNCFFDVPYLRTHGFTLPYSNIQHDTMLVHSIICPEEPHNLGYIVSRFGSTPYWKEVFQNRKVSILDMDQSVMRTYNLRDCVVLHQVLQPMLSEVQRLGLAGLYINEIRPLVEPVMEMHLRGVAFDPGQMTKFKKAMSELIGETEKELFELGNIPPDTLNLDSDDDLRWFLFGQEPNKFKKIPELANKKPGTKIYLELQQLKATHDLVKPIYMPHGFRGVQTDGGKIGVGKEGLQSYQIHLQNRLEAIDEMKTDHTMEANDVQRLLVWLAKYQDYSSYGKLLTSFTNYRPSPDGRIHPSWLMHGTATGRLSCKDPNLMQLPKRGNGKTVREFFPAGPGCKLISADFENAEVALLGYEAQDQVIIDIYEQGRNIHDENTKILFGLEPSDPLWNIGRAAAKVFQFGGLSYGGSDREIYRKILMAAPALNLTFAKFRDAKDSWMQAHPAYVQWKEQVKIDVLANRKIYNAFGRVRIFLGPNCDIVKEAMNFKIQSLGANLINRAMIRLQNKLTTNNMQAGFILQIHDQLVLEAPDNEVDIVKEWLRNEMERPFEMYGRKCIIRADVSVGQNFGELE